MDLNQDGLRPLLVLFACFAFLIRFLLPERIPRAGLASMSIRISVFPFLAFRAHAATLAALALAGCAAPNPPPSTAPLAFDRSEHDRQTGLLGAAPPQLPDSTPMSATPAVPPGVTDNVRTTAPTPLDAAASGNLSVSIEQMPLPSFIQAIYGGILKLNYSVDAAVGSRQDLITFRTPRPLSAAKLAELSALLLKSYGVVVQDFGGVLRIVPATSNTATVPQIRRGRALPTVPQALRPVFQYIEFEAIRSASALPSIRKIVGERVQLQEDGMNGVLITGQSDDVQIALDLIRVFDQPSMRGQRSVRITPRFWGAEEFARRLTEVLRAEGYVAASQVDPTAPIIVLPMAAINSVLVFAQRDDILQHVQAWAQELDQVSQVQQGGSLFTYPVKNSDAAELARSLNELIGGASIAPGGLNHGLLFPLTRYGRRLRDLHTGDALKGVIKGEHHETAPELSTRRARPGSDSCSPGTQSGFRRTRPRCAHHGDLYGGDHATFCRRLLRY